MTRSSSSPIVFSLLTSLVLLAAAACNQVVSTPRNVMIVSIDTLRADHVGAYGAHNARTPTIDRLAAEGVRFDAAFSPAPLTLPSHATLLTGADPDRHGVRHNGIHRLGDEAKTLAERFSEAGYSTAAAVGSLVIDAESGLGQGFDDYDDEIGQLGDHGTAQRRAESVNAAAIRWLDQTYTPFFLFVHYYDPHRPYDPPAAYAETAASAYDAEISYADAMLGALLSHLEARGILDQTLIVVTSDHGEALGEHDELTHGHAIYDATQRVPLVMSGPGVPRGRVVREIARLADIAPTLLARLGLPALESIDGIDLAPLWSGETGPGRVAYLESLATRYDHGWSPLYGLRSREHLYVRAPAPELYAVADDPAQRTNLLDMTPDAHRSVIADYERQLAARLTSSVTAERQELDRDTLAQLHALGYALPENPIEENGLDPKIGRKSLALYHEGDALYLAGRASEAAERFEKMLEISPHSGEAWISLGAARLNAGELEKAYVATQTGIEKTPTRGSAWLQLGVIEMVMAQPARAEASFRRAIELNPQTPGGHLRLLMALVTQQKLSEARAQDRHLATLEAADEIWLRRIADFWEAEGQTEMALAAYQRVLACAPDSQRDHMHAAIALIRLGRTDEAGGHLARSGAVALQPRAQKALVAAYLETGHLTQARGLLESIPPQATNAAWARARLDELSAADG